MIISYPRIRRLWHGPGGLALAGAGPVCLWARDAAKADEMQHTRENATRLPGATLPAIRHSHRPDTGCAAGRDIILLAIPTQQALGVFWTRTWCGAGQLPSCGLLQGRRKRHRAGADADHCRACALGHAGDPDRAQLCP